MLNEPNDENQNPFQTLEHGEQRDERALHRVVDGEKDVKAATARTVPSKHGPHGRRVTASPAKLDSHFRAGKSAIHVFEDGQKGKEAPPTTPRHRDAQAKKVAVTPRHRLILAGTQTTPRTPRTPSTPSNATTAIYNQARQLFSRCSAPGRLVGRDGERSRLAEFINTALRSKSGGCLYVSGPPGTGKSALVHEVTQTFEETANVSHATINCMSIKTTKDLSQKLSESLGLEEGVSFEYLKSCFVKEKPKDTRKFLVILDEVDRLVDLDLELLYNLFAWSMQASSRLVLVSIANALDLTDRFLPRLKSRSLKPELLPFMPYTAAQIAEVLTSKLRTLSDSAQTPFLQPPAVHFCAKKVAGQTGDLRKAFDICRRVIDLVEQETRERDAKTALELSPSKTPLMENINLSSSPTSRSPAQVQNVPTYTIDTAPKGTIAHVAKVTAQVFGNGTTHRLASLNVQQKAVLCALAALERRKQEQQSLSLVFATPSKHNAMAPSIKQLYDAYTTLCQRESLLHPLTNTEFRDVVSGLEALGLLSPAEGRGGSFIVAMTPSKTPGRRGKSGFGATAVGDERRVASAVGGKELAGALDGPGSELLKDILEGDVLLS